MDGLHAGMKHGHNGLLSSFVLRVTVMKELFSAWSVMLCRYKRGENEFGSGGLTCDEAEEEV